ncbi:DUF962 domain-containing protein [Polaromonas jejuensis]|uniref:DUF962 domain-containing protein n=1 Tax=Polaromonas jejuensis TaxID=457502 RepID=A0ABW0Q7D1_9BURK|nr:Mpo1-like protein [Polaromonas jejuensis]
MTTATDTTAPAAAAPRKVDRLLAHYGESHQNPRNELIHFIAIPLIMLSLVGMLFALHPYVAYVFIAASMVYYARLSWVFLLTMVLWSAVTIVLVFAMGPRRLQICLAIFVGAWILQFIGHKMEGKKPSFLEDIQYLWVGPLFALSKLFGKVGIRW